MDTEIREWFDEIWAYCEENWVAVLAFAGVALVLLLSVVLISAAKREDRKTLQEQNEQETGAEEILPGAEPEPEAAEDPEQELEPEPEVQVQEPDETRELQEAAMGMVDSLVKSVESAAGASGQKVESIELKIEKAQLTIRYAGDAEKTVTEDLFTEKTSEKETAEAEEEITAAAEVETEKTDFAENSGRPKRFGFDNMNMARSGRVYTEEELLNQIRD
ncbi:MAG: hypothetical protein IKU09_07025 [Firmicutes bacterium]|nr:hypothetical protein [Bacillota bacterium]